MSINDGTKTCIINDYDSYGSPQAIIISRFPAAFSDIFAKIRHQQSSNKWVGFEEFRRIQFKAYLIPPLSALGNCRWFEPHAHKKDD